MIFWPSPEEARAQTVLRGTLLIAGQVGVNATAIFCEVSEFAPGTFTALSGQILQSKGFSCGGKVQPRLLSKKGQAASSLGSVVL